MHRTAYQHTFSTTSYTTRTSSPRPTRRNKNANPTRNGHSNMAGVREETFKNQVVGVNGMPSSASTLESSKSPSACNTSAISDKMSCKKPTSRYYNPMKRKTTVCLHWKRGKCRLGSNCNFIHPESDPVKEDIASNPTSISPHSTFGHVQRKKSNPEIVEPKKDNSTSKNSAPAPKPKQVPSTKDPKRTMTPGSISPVPTMKTSISHHSPPPTYQPSQPRRTNNAHRRTPARFIIRVGETESPSLAVTQPPSTAEILGYPGLCQSGYLFTQDRPGLGPPILNHSKTMPFTPGQLRPLSTPPSIFVPPLSSPSSSFLDPLSPPYASSSAFLPPPGLHPLLAIPLTPPPYDVSSFRPCGLDKWL